MSEELKPKPRKIQWTTTPPYDKKDINKWFVRRSGYILDLCIITHSQTNIPKLYASGRTDSYDLYPSEDVLWYGPIPMPEEK